MSTIQTAAVRQEVMDEQRYKQLLARFRHMMTSSGVTPQDVSDEQLLEKVNGKTHEEKIDNLEAMTSLVPETYWWDVGL